MNDLGKLWLGPGERIESIRNANTIRFIVHKPKADIIIAQLNKTLKTIESKALPLSLFTATPLEEGVIEELGRITNTHIRYNETGRRVSSIQLAVPPFSFPTLGNNSSERWSNICIAASNLVRSAQKGRGGPQPCTRRPPSCSLQAASHSLGTTARYRLFDLRPVA